MKRWWLWVVVVAAAVAVLTWWLTRDDEGGSDAPTAASGANEGALPAGAGKTRWSEPIVARGSRRLTGVVLRDGAPVSGAVVTALAAHGADVLSDLPCQCDNHCGLKLLACGCAEAAGQLVELVGARTGESVPLGRATSGADGAFVIEGLDETSLTLWADAHEGIAWKSDVGSDATDVKLELQRGRFIKGKVTNTRDASVSGALVTAIFSEQSRFFDTMTRADGTFELGPLPNGKYALVAMQAGLLPDHKQVSEDTLTEQTLVLSVPRALAGVVRRDGEPVPSATVKLEGMHRKRTVTTDAQGAFRVERLRPGKYELTAEGAGGLGHATTTIARADDREGVVINLERGVSLDGVVIDDHGAPVTEARVSVQSGNDWKNEKTDGEGRFRFALVPEGERNLWVTKRGYLAVENLKVTGGGAPVKVTMTRAAVLSGRVQTADGTLVTNFDITAWRADAGEGHDDAESETATDGGFALDLTPGEYSVRVTPRDFTSASITATAPQEGLVITVEAGGTVRGQALDADGAPTPNTLVTATTTGDFRRATTDGDGRFTMKGLAAGHWKFRARRDTGATASAEFDLAGQATVDVTLRPRRGAPLAGVVLTAEGKPVAAARMFIASGDGDDYDPAAMEGASTDADGRFRVTSLPAGKVTIMVMNGTSPHREIATAPDEKLVIKLRRGTTISGVVVDDTGKPVDDFTIDHKPVEVKNGRFSANARKGKQSYAIDAPGFAQRMFEVDAREGDNDVGTIRLSRGARLTGRVYDAVTNAPIAGALVDVSATQPGASFYLAEDLGAVTTNARGEYTIVADPSSTWVAATHQAYASARQPRPPGAANVDIAMKRGASLVVSVLDAGGKPLRDAFVLAATAAGDRSVLEPKGETFTGQGLAAGEWTVSAMTRDRVLYKPSTVTLSDAPAQVTLRPVTDTVEVTASAPAEVQMVLFINASITDFDSYRRFGTTSTNVPARPGTTAKLFAGTWTAVMSGPEKFAVQPFEVKAGTPLQLQLTPQWQAMPEE